MPCSVSIGHETENNLVLSRGVQARDVVLLHDAKQKKIRATVTTGGESIRYIEALPLCVAKTSSDAAEH